MSVLLLTTIFDLSAAKSQALSQLLEQLKNKLAEICEKYLHKGDKIYCEGKLKSKQWEQDGVKRYMTEIHVSDMTFLSTKTSADSSLSQNDNAKEINDDLPF